MSAVGWLSGYRVLDLSDHRGLIAGALFAQLGADVVQVEPAGGSSARGVGPFHAGASLFWESFAAGKRSIVCDLQSARGREEFNQLAAVADVVIESGPDGPLVKTGLAWPWLRSINPRAVQVTISAFGTTGPKAGYAESDLIVWAAGGPLFGNRDADGIPLRISAPQSYLHAGADAVMGALLALFARRQSGLGQHVGVSAQVCVAQTTLSSILASTVNDTNFSVTAIPLKKKALDLSGSGARTRRSKWKIADGYAEVHLAMGPAGWSTNNFLAWMKESNALPDGPAAQCDWRELPTLIETGKIDDDDVEKVRDAVGRFLAGRTKQEVLEAGLARRITIAPILTTADLLESPHLRERNVFQTLRSKVGSIALPTRFAQFDGLRQITPAPGIDADRIAVTNAWKAGAAKVEVMASGAKAPMPSPLHGLKVLDLTWVVAGPTIGRTLADFGATVVRVESSQRLDAARIMGPFPEGERDIQKSLMYENVNAGKYGITLDLGSPGGREVAKDLAAWADVVIESFAPGLMRRWTLDYQTLSANHADLIMVSTSLMGQSGIYSAAAGFGNIGSALSGFQYLAGQPGAQPTGPFGPYTDYVGPKFALIALLSAREQVRATGKGCHIDLAQVEATLEFIAPQLALTSLTGEPAQPLGNRDPQFAPHGVFRCRGEDTWVAVAVRDDTEWRRCATLIGGPALAQNPRFATLPDRKTHEAELEQLVADWAMTESAQAIEDKMQALKIPAHVVANSADFCRDPQIAALNHLITIPHSLTGDVTIEGPRYHLSDTPYAIQRSAPCLGRDNRYVLCAFAGYTHERIDQLEADGALK